MLARLTVLLGLVLRHSVVAEVRFSFYKPKAQSLEPF